MPFVSDFVMIRGDNHVWIGDDGLDLWEANFNTGALKR